MQHALTPLASLLLGEGALSELPALGDLVAAAVSLAAGSRRKVLLPLAVEPAELALVRSGDDVLVSFYGTDSAPEVVVHDRRVALGTLLDQCAAAARSYADRVADGTAGQIHRRLADRAARAAICADPAGGGARAVRRGGLQEAPADEVPLAFGYRALVPRGDDKPTAAARADVHALLFEGELWAWVRGRRVKLLRGPICLAAQRMVAAAHALVDAWDAGRPANVRLRTADFQIGVRLDRAGEASVTLRGDGSPGVTVTALDVPSATLPILRLASDLVRSLVAVDRSQSRNLRVRSLRDEVRALRRRVKSRDRRKGFVNHDPDRLRSSAQPVKNDDPPSLPPARSVGMGRLRFAERWRAEIEELDATSTFFCGDRLVVATPRRALALCRDSGEVLWVREGLGGASAMAGTALIRSSAEGHIELCDVADGEAFATAQIDPRPNGHLHGVLVGGGSLPPTYVTVDGDNRLVGIDLRNGEQRFRYSTRGPGPVRLRRAGRVLLAVAGDGSVDALDVASGEIAWRFADTMRFHFAPAICGDVVVAAAGVAGGKRGAVFGLDLYSGELLWRRALDVAPSAAPIPAGRLAALALGNRKASLCAFEPKDGALRFMIPDPGLARGGAALFFDRMLVVNTPSGRVRAVDLEDGSLRWDSSLADPLADDVPRRLEPVLRGGALFVPSACIHVLRPHDGSPIGVPLPCDLVPDTIRVDERGWVYVAEESGVIAAYGPVPHLTLVPTG